MSQLTRYRRLIARHFPSLNLVIRNDDSGTSISAYRCRKWKSIPRAQPVSLADNNEPVVKLCETKHGSRFLKAMGVHLPKDDHSDRGDAA